MAFKFRLEKVLKIREQEVEEARMALMEAERRVEETKMKITQTQQEIKDRNQELIASNYERAQDHLRCIKYCQNKLKILKKELEDRKEAVRQAFIALQEAQQKLEAMKKLKEKQAEEYRIEMDKLEQKINDEKVSLKFAADMVQKAQELEEYGFETEDELEEEYI